MIAREPSLSTRPAAVAGSFYPRAKAELEAAVETFMSQAAKRAASGLIGLIAPHAGYVYSGPVAASAFAALDTGATFERVLLIGPPHYVPVQGIAAPSSRMFATPIGEIEVDQETIAALLDAGLITINDRAHAPEHALEVELPFLQRALGRFRLIPLLVGDAPPEETAAVINAVLDERTLLVVSTDLSHYLDDISARVRDNMTAKAIERFDFDQLGPDDACGFAALNGALCAGHRNSWRIDRLDLRNSGDTSGDRGRVVGYGAWALSKPEGVEA
ncbi:AmmeMemoRadiSam system protein B [Methyloceanibacter sp.]|uniref:AmmeMemoRadiSam system protein B n=1 Tax=Methyloceanibacter sp. TaxID=1965321 RepID=UPI003D6D69B1